MIYDAFTFFNEFDLLEIRLHELKDVADKVVLIESPQTFAGNPKPLWFQENRERFKEFENKIIYLVAEPKEFKIPMDRERFQRNCLMRGLKGCSPDDTILIGDVDEIPRAEAVKANLYRDCIPLHQPMYIYYLNGFWDWGWNGTMLIKYSIVKGKFKEDLHAVRLWRRRKYKIPNGGWHFSYLGGAEEVVKKVQAYSHQELNIPDLINVKRIKQRMKDGLEVGKRNRTVRYIPMDDTFPRYVRENEKKFSHLIRPYEGMLMENNCAVIIPTSFVRRCHPCTTMIQKAVGSLSKIGLEKAPRIFSCDFYDDPRYLRYKENLKKVFLNDIIIEASSSVGLRGVLLQAFAKVETKFVFVFQHDFEIIGGAPLSVFMGIFNHEDVKYLRLNRLVNSQNPWDNTIDLTKRGGCYVLRTSGWSDNPHFARTDYYQNIVLPTSESLGESLGVETCMWNAMQKSIASIGFEEAQKTFGTFIFGSLNSEPFIQHMIWKRGKKPICVDQCGKSFI